MIRSVVLHGPFAAYHDGPIQMGGDTVAEIVEAVTRQIKGFAPHPVTGKARIKVEGFDTYESLFETLGEDVEEIHIVPQFIGGKNSNALMQIGLGLALVGLGFALGPAAYWGSMAIKAGALMVLGGLAQILAPAPEADKETTSKNQYLGAPKNTVAIGTRIPILYGEDRVYGHYISFDINAQEQEPDN